MSIERVCRMHPDADYIIHAGDGAGDLEYVTDIRSTVVAVCGNCDVFGTLKNYPMFEKISVGNIRVAVTHGHRLDVKYGYGRATAYARDNELDILIFGHTHIPYEYTFRADDRFVRLFNPGSLREGSFGLITIKGDAILLSHGNLRRK